MLPESDTCYKYCPICAEELLPVEDDDLLQCYCGFSEPLKTGAFVKYIGDILIDISAQLGFVDASYQGHKLTLNEAFCGDSLLPLLIQRQSDLVNNSALNGLLKSNLKSISSDNGLIRRRVTVSDGFEISNIATESLSLTEVLSELKEILIAIGVEKSRTLDFDLIPGVTFNVSNIESSQAGKQLENNTLKTASPYVTS